MNSTIQVRLLEVVGACLRPIARMMLRSGIGYKQFAELAKTAFMQEALGERDSRGRTTNLSRVAIKTGLSRKEVSRLRARLLRKLESDEDEVDSHFHSGHAARVLQLWHADSRFQDAVGAPLRLPFSGDGVSFSALVRAAGGDVPPGAVRTELSSAKAIEENHEGLLSPVKRYFVPADVGEELVVGFTHFVMPVLEGLSRNTDRGCKHPFIQRLAYSDRLMPSAVPNFREVARNRANELVQLVDDWLSAHEANSEVENESELRVGLGVFYYEGAPPVKNQRISTLTEQRAP